ncbi:MAG: hypothetical protein HY736_04465 [Verrucomicrobia bacterium]|nr:hypothetical protein [Verrucomicrobiota bacterium]
MSNSTQVALRIIPFKYPSGHLTNRVTGTIRGERVQKNFPADAEARTFMNGLVAAAGQGKSAPQRVTTTNLPRDVDLREAEMIAITIHSGGPRSKRAASSLHCGRKVGAAAMNWQPNSSWEANGLCNPIDDERIRPILLGAEQCQWDQLSLSFAGWTEGTDFRTSGTDSNPIVHRGAKLAHGA